MCAEWLDNPILFGAVANNNLLGFIEVNYEEWNSRLRISNIKVEEEYRNKWIGKALINKVIEYGKKEKISSTNFRNAKLQRKCNKILFKLWV